MSLKVHGSPRHGKTCKKPRSLEDKRSGKVHAKKGTYRSTCIQTYYIPTYILKRPALDPTAAAYLGEKKISHQREKRSRPVTNDSD